MRNILRSIKNSLGFTMIQALVGSFIASVVALGVSTMLVNSTIQSRKIQLLQTLTEQKIRIEYLLRDQTSFDRSLIGAANTHQLFVSLKGSSMVTELDYASQTTKFVIYDSAGQAVYDMLDTYASGLPVSASGITEKGNSCSGFNAVNGSGNDNCPISYRVLIGADCPTGTTCRDPQLKIVARMIYNPASTSSSQLNKFRNLLPQENSAGYDSIADAIEDGKYDAVVKRTASAVAKAFQLSVSHPNVSGTGLGACPTSGWAIHPRTSSTGWTEDFDPHDLVTPENGGTKGHFNFKESGYYNCALTVPAFAVGGFTVRLWNITTGASVGNGSSLAPQWSEAIARVDTSFNILNIAHVFRVEMRCDSTSGDTDLGLSRSASYSTPYPLVILNCSKMDTAF